MITTEQEREKYKKMWAVSGYRQNSPGANLVPLFLEKADAIAGESIVDAGCGTGRAGLALSQSGFNVTLMDICPEAIEVLTLPFIEANLWEPQKIEFDWVYCCDVLEHIPPEHVEATLDNLASMGREGAFVQIACHPDGFGDMIGETLHLTVHPDEWWFPKLEKRWAIEWAQQMPGPRLVAVLGAK